MNTDLYYPLLQRTRLSVFTFGLYLTDELDPASENCPDLIKKFCEDDEIQYLVIGSGNIGFLWKLQKLYRRKGKPSPRLQRFRFAFREMAGGYCVAVVCNATRFRGRAQALRGATRSESGESSRAGRSARHRAGSDCDA